MPIPTNKLELQQAIAQNYAKLKKELDTVSVEKVLVAELGGHRKDTHMSIHNLVAYLTGWGQLVLKWNRLKERNEPVDFPETGYKWNELGQLAQKFYLDYEKDSFHILMQKLDDTVAAILALTDRKSDTELYSTAWYEKWTLGRMIQFNTSSPYANAAARIRKWKKARVTT